MDLRNIHIFENTEDLNLSAAEFIIQIATDAIAARGVFCVALSGGNTPLKVYALLASEKFKDQLDWSKTHVFWGDERCLPLDDERNNAHQAKIILLSKINIPSENIHLIPVNLSPAEAALSYENEIAEFFAEKSKEFDLILLGLGENGHTASLFPNTDVLEDNSQGIRAVYLEDQQLFRITMTAPLINASRVILFLVSGKEKAEIVKSVLSNTYLPEKYPAQLINDQSADLFWFLDQAAISLLETETN